MKSKILIFASGVGFGIFLVLSMTPKVEPAASPVKEVSLIARTDSLTESNKSADTIWVEWDGETRGHYEVWVDGDGWSALIGTTKGNKYHIGSHIKFGQTNRFRIVNVEGNSQASEAVDYYIPAPITTLKVR
jgi:hypothetical protein